MNGARLSRKLHKWLSFAVGVQLLLWSVSGFYMVVVHIDTIHGDMLVKNMDRAIDISEIGNVPLAEIVERFPDATALTLASLAGNPVLRIDRPVATSLIDARSGEVISPLPEATLIAIASYHYAGPGEVSSANKIVNQPPGEVRFIPLPVWRVDFDDRWGTSFYISPDSGRFITRRHTLWRVFDFLWMLHIMDYDAREDVNNRLLQGFSLLALLLGLSGTWLLLYSFRRPSVTGA